MTFEDGLKLATPIISGVAALAAIMSVYLVSRANRLARATSVQIETMKLDSAKQLEDGKQEQARQLESLRTNLRVDAYQREVQFSKLHERRLTLISEVYTVAWDTQGLFQRWVNPMQQVSPDESENPQQALRKLQVQQQNEATKSLNDLIRLVGRHSLWFRPQRPHALMLSCAPSTKRV